MWTTIRGELFLSEGQGEKLDELMWLQFSCMRYAYDRLREGKSKSEIGGEGNSKKFAENLRSENDLPMMVSDIW